MADITSVEDGWMETFTGKKFTFQKPTPEIICIRDIAHALALLTRYNGHTIKFYSVAEHCVLLTRYMRKKGYPTRMLMTCLLHDAAEAYIGDMPRPVKVRLPSFKRVENVIAKVISEKYHLYWPEPKALKSVDRRALTDERAQAMPPSNNHWMADDLEPIGIELKFWSPAQAEAKFMGQYGLLKRKMEEEHPEFEMPSD
jgi:hypothetical protein